MTAGGCFGYAEGVKKKRKPTGISAFPSRPDLATVGPGLNLVSVRAIANELGLNEAETLRWLEECSLGYVDVAGVPYAWLHELAYGITNKMYPGRFTYDEYLDHAAKVAARFAGIRKWVLRRYIESIVSKPAERKRYSPGRTKQGKRWQLARSVRKSSQEEKVNA